MNNKSDYVLNSISEINLTDIEYGDLYHRCTCMKYSRGDHERMVMYDILYECGPEVLIIHSSTGFPFSLKHLRRLKGRVKILITEHHAFDVIVNKIDDFSVFVVFSCEFNDFEHEFMRQVCITKQKTILLLSEHLNCNSDENTPLSLNEFKNTLSVSLTNF
ncbi:hypothetical protein CWI42_120930 [Ordospora colligata]|uniref:Uncharacterized protein n=1 Tax=Ordospora colligata OC4 TaxID=1354746 RepID=A0A0B2UCV5_9MICR|nr:uncharacterized protein M896_120930 [Ordospora colligata OC4]KHN68871.1 hypothetical protein M896_120930 [Ordospora colligata OC4]TBU13905.1 hypothetical protein CWI40_120930 [Ordospora colligata]TBU14094.1 hypothetical protein CWI41_120930 [Ordospora colligata]TBU17763.1 hypothetical protein CWI42_120930 [Ordospora colligata]